MTVVTETDRVPRTMHTYRCPACGNYTFRDDRECLHCGTRLIWAHEIEQCSQCRRYKGIDGLWKAEPDQEIIERNLGKGIIGNVTETYCPECLDDKMEEI